MTGVLLFAALVWPGRVNADIPKAIELLYFRGTGQNNAVFLEWATGTEFNTAGFMVERADGESGPYTILSDIGFIPAAGGGIGGAQYDALDTSVTNGQLYWYRLIEFETSGTENREDPISVTAGQPTATPTQTATATPPPTKTATPATPTRTPTTTAAAPTATSAATATANSTSQGSSQNRTPTPLPTNIPGASPTSPPPTPTGNADNSAGSQTGGDSTVFGDDGSQSLAQAGTTTPGQEYPPPGLPSPTAESFDPYPDGQPSPTPPATAVIDPAATSTLTIDKPGPQGGPSAVGTPVVIGIDREDDADDAPGQEPAVGDQSLGSTLFLWGGFLAALLIFIAGIVGAIMIFARQNNRSG